MLDILFSGRAFGSDGRDGNKGKYKRKHVSFSPRIQLHFSNGSSSTIHRSVDIRCTGKK